MPAESTTNTEPAGPLTKGQRLARELEEKAQLKQGERGRDGEVLQTKAIDNLSALFSKIGNARRVLWIALGCIVASAAIAVMTYVWSTNKQEKAAKALLDVLKAYSTPAVTDEERAAELQAFANVANSYAGTKVGSWATLAEARRFLDAGDNKRAAEKYREVLGEVKSDATLSWLALTGLVYSYEAEGAYDEARAQLESMRQLGPYYMMMAEYHNARLLERMGKFEEARQIWTALQKRLGEQQMPMPELQNEVAEKLAAPPRVEVPNPPSEPTSATP